MVLNTLGLGPLCGGVVAGVLHTVLGPDHLCSIVTLSACQGAEAFWFGVRWAAGHLSGMIVVAVVLSLLNYRVGGDVLETYEHYANYAVGFMLVFFGGYFLLHADEYFDSEWKPKKASCACHGHARDDEAPQASESTPLQKPKGASESTPLQKPKAMKAAAHTHDVATVRKAGSTVVGFVQGIACPAGLVGMAFLRQYSDSMVEITIFITVFLLSTMLAMGLVAMTYGILTDRYVSSAALARGIYCTSCALSLTLGVAWIALNATGSLELFFPHDHDHDHGHAHGAHDHDHHGHGHHHHAALNAYKEQFGASSVANMFTMATPAF